MSEPGGAVPDEALVLERPVLDGAGIVLGHVPVQPWRPQPAADQAVGDLGLDEVVAQALGAASMCWANVAGAGEFDSLRAAWVLAGLMDHLNAVIDQVVAGTTRAVRPVSGAGPAR